MFLVSQNQYPQTLRETVKICLLTMTPAEKEVVKNTAKEDLIKFHMNWAMTMRNKFGMWEGNTELIKSCKAFDSDGASAVIVEAVWKELNRPH